MYFAKETETSGVATDGGGGAGSGCLSTGPFPFFSLMFFHQMPRLQSDHMVSRVITQCDQGPWNFLKVNIMFSKSLFNFVLSLGKRSLGEK